LSGYPWINAAGRVTKRRQRVRAGASLLEEIGDRDRVVLGADLAVAGLVDQKLVSARR
jgi:hypothetical protein